MGDLQRNSRLGPRQILAIALTERELQNIRLVIRGKRFTEKAILITKISLILMGMCFVTEVTALRTLTLLLLTILIGLSFYLIWEALQRCEVVTARLNQEIRDFRELMQAQNSHSDQE